MNMSVLEQFGYFNTEELVKEVLDDYIENLDKIKGDLMDCVDTLRSSIKCDDISDVHRTLEFIETTISEYEDTLYAIDQIKHYLEYGEMIG